MWFPYVLVPLQDSFFKEYVYGSGMCIPIKIDSATDTKHQETTKNM